MKAKPSNFLTMTVTLVAVTAIAAVSLGFVFQITKEPIEKAKFEKQIRAIAAVAGMGDNDPVAEAFEVNGLEVFPVKLSGSTISIAVKTSSEKGYSGSIVLMVGINNEGEILGIQVLEHKETPGLGSKIKEEAYMAQYIGYTLATRDFRVTKDGGAIDAISGATISSRAFSEAVERALNHSLQ